MALSFTTAGNLNNTGTITVGAGSVLTATGSGSTAGLTLASTSILDFQLGSAPGTGQFGVVDVTGATAITLAGAINLILVNDYIPTTGDTFTLLTDPGHSSTTFTGQAQGSTVHAGGRSFTISYTGSGSSQVTLTAQALSSVTWKGGSSGSWDTASNWSDNAVPTITTNVSITTANVTITASGTDVCDSITTGASDKISVTGGSLTVWSFSIASYLAGGFNLSGGTLAFAGSVNINGSSVWSGGTLEGPSINILSTASVAVNSSKVKSLSPFVQTASSSTPIYVTVNQNSANSNIDEVIGGVATPLSAKSLPTPDSLVFDKNDQILYTADSAAQLRRYNPATGADTLVCSFASGSNPGDLALSPDGNSVLVSLRSAKEFVQVDLNYATGTGTLDPNVSLDTSSYGNTNSDGIAYGPDGRLFAALSRSTFAELTLVPYTSLTVKTSNEDTSYTGLDGVSYDYVANKLYTADETAGYVYQIDPDDLAGNYLDTGNVTAPDGLEFDGNQSIYVVDRGTGTGAPNARLLQFGTTNFQDESPIVIAAIPGADDVLPRPVRARRPKSQPSSTITAPSPIPGATRCS